MSKTIKTKQIDQFQDTVARRLKLLELSDSPVGFLELLSQFMDYIKKSSVSAKIYRGLSAVVERDAHAARASKQRMVDWLLSKVTILEEASAKNGWSSTWSVQQYKAYLKGDRPELILSGSFWHGVCMDFMQVCNSVASYGDTQLFDGFATIRIKKDLISFDEPPIQVDEPKKISPDSPEGKLLIEKLKHGFINAVIRKNDWIDRIDHEVEYGVVQEIRYPDDEYAAVLKGITDKALAMAQDSSLLQTFHELNQFSQVRKIKHAPEESLPNDLICCDELSNRWRWQLFLNSFGMEWDKAPAPRNKLLRLVQRFVLLLEEEIVQGVVRKGPRQMKEAARELVRDVLEQIIRPLSLDERNQRPYDSIRFTVWKAAENSGIVGLKDACEPTLIDEECSKFAKKHSWRPIRGPGKRKKESKV